MGGGLVLFGIGGNTSGGLVDAITGPGSGGDTGAERFQKQIKDARARLAANGRDEAAWVELIRAQANLAGTGEQFNSATGEYTEAGKDDLRAATEAWKDYLAIEPRNKEEQARVASRIVQAYAALEDLPNLVQAQEIVALNRDAVGPYAALAQYAYLAGQTRKGDLACEKAVELEDAEQRNQLRGDCESFKQQGAQAAIASVTPAPVTPTPEATKEAAEKPAKKGKGSK